MKVYVYCIHFVILSHEENKQQQQQKQHHYKAIYYAFNFGNIFQCGYKVSLLKIRKKAFRKINRTKTPFREKII